MDGAEFVVLVVLSIVIVVFVIVVDFFVILGSCLPVFRCIRSLHPTGSALLLLPPLPLLSPRFPNEVAAEEASTEKAEEDPIASRRSSIGLCCLFFLRASILRAAFSRSLPAPPLLYPPLVYPLALDRAQSNAASCSGGSSSSSSSSSSMSAMSNVIVVPTLFAAIAAPPPPAAVRGEDAIVFNDECVGGRV